LRPRRGGARRETLLARHTSVRRERPGHIVSATIRTMYDFTRSTWNHVDTDGKRERLARITNDGSLPAFSFSRKLPDHSSPDRDDSPEKRIPRGKP
jgi:hypothetical protein